MTLLWARIRPGLKTLGDDCPMQLRTSMNVFVHAWVLLQFSLPSTRRQLFPTAALWCLCLCIYVCMYIYICVCVCTHTHAHVYILISVPILVSISISICIFIPISICICLSIYLRIYTYVYIHSKGLRHLAAVPICWQLSAEYHNTMSSAREIGLSGQQLTDEQKVQQRNQ